MDSPLLKPSSRVWKHDPIQPGLLSPRLLSFNKLKMIFFWTKQQVASILLPAKQERITRVNKFNSQWFGSFSEESALRKRKAFLKRYRKTCPAFSVLLNILTLRPGQHNTLFKILSVSRQWSGLLHKVNSPKNRKG